MHLGRLIKVTDFESEHKQVSLYYRKDMDFFLGHLNIQYNGEIIGIPLGMMSKDKNGFLVIKLSRHAFSKTQSNQIPYMTNIKEVEGHPNLYYFLWFDKSSRLFLEIFYNDSDKEKFFIRNPIYSAINRMPISYKL